MKIIFKFLFIFFAAQNAMSCDIKNFSAVGSIKGVNFGGALDDVREIRWKNYPRVSDIYEIKKIGFNTIRLPINWSAHSDNNGNIDPVFFERVDYVVEKIICSGFFVVIDVHNFNEIYEDVSGNVNKLANIWKNIAEHYKKYGNCIIYEIINEPRKDLSGDNNIKTIKIVSSAIRSVDKSKYIIFSGENWGNIDGLVHTSFPCDDKSILSFHYYDPFKFTHQGAWWIKNSNDWILTKWPKNPQEKEKVFFDFEKLKSIKKNGCSAGFVVGEFGVYDAAPVADRIDWVRSVRVAAEMNGFGWIYWQYMFDFKIFDESLGLNNFLVDALFK